MLVSIHLVYDLQREQHADQERPSAKLDTTHADQERPLAKLDYYRVCSTFKYMFRLFQLARTGIFIKRRPSSHIIVTIVILK